MLIPLRDLADRYRMHITGVLHVGAHTGEEAEAYNELRIPTVVWIEANPEVIPELERHVGRFGHHVVHALVSDVDDLETTFHVTNNRQSSSILQFGTHRVVSPDVHFTHDVTMRAFRVDTLEKAGVFNGAGLNFMNLDLQGAELHCLRGAERQLERTDYIYTEINVDELYKGCVRLPELDRWLAEREFVRVETAMAGNAGWGDALYVREPVLKSRQKWA